jgi:hypothetical protein
MLTWCVTMEKNGKRWMSNTMARCKFQAMLQMTTKYGCGAKAIDAVQIKNSDAVRLEK